MLLMLIILTAMSFFSEVIMTFLALFLILAIGSMCIAGFLDTAKAYKESTHEDDEY